MAGLLIKCPECSKALNIRTSERPTATATTAYVYCEPCGIRAQVSAELHHIQIGTFNNVNPAYIFAQDKKA